MFKKKLSVLLATALVTVMLPVTALAGEWNTNGGTATVPGESYSVDPIISVELPGDLAFGINPLYLDADGDPATNDSTQIVTSQYMITNYSNVDVLITASTTAATTANSGDKAIVFLQDNTLDGTTKELATASDGKRNVYLVQMLPATAPTIGTGEAIGVNKLNVNSFTLASGGADEIGGLVLGSGAATAMFKLDSYVETEEGVMTSNSVSGFTFAGAVDPNATYLPGEVTVSTVFTLNTLTELQSTNGYETRELNGASFDATVVQTVSN